jgi:hypothetical protein
VSVWLIQWPDTAAKSCWNQAGHGSSWTRRSALIRTPLPVSEGPSTSKKTPESLARDKAGQAVQVVVPRRGHGDQEPNGIDGR